MANWYYYNESGEKVGPIKGRELKQLAQQGTIIPEMVVEDEKGHTALAKNVTGLLFSETAQSESTLLEPDPFSAAPPATEPPLITPVPFAQMAQVLERFCTNCGQPVSEHAVACMSCGAKPVGHRKFCRQCGVVLNPEQIVCTTCGAEVSAANIAGGIGDTITNLKPAFQTKEITDIGFAHFLTPILVQINWWTIVVVTVLAYLNFLRFISDASKNMGMPGDVQLGLFIMGTGIVALILINSRIFLESIAIFFRMERHQRTIKKILENETLSNTSDVQP